MSKFTPGPWEIDEHLDIKKDTTFIAPISIIPNHLAETRANARLIVHAPEMYALLKRLSKQTEEIKKLLVQID